MQGSEKQDPLTYQIIGAAIDVHRELGPGLLESLYEEAFCLELGIRNLQYERQKPISVQYRSHSIRESYRRCCC